MSAASHDDIVEILGDVDDLFVERIVDTGASIHEIAEALDDLEDERRFGEQHRVEASPRVAAVRAILEELLDEGDEDTSWPVVGDSA
jgi:hypothetical protein